MSRLSRPRVRARDRYAVLGELARGGSGVVLRVWDARLGRTLAMKVLDAPDSDPREAERTLARLAHEARVVRRLAHPGVPPILDVGVGEDGRAYLTMPLCEGRTLEEGLELARARAQGWTPELALLALARVCDVVAHAHSRGVVHCDLKPSNVLVGPSGGVHVLDWGLARRAGERESRLSALGLPPGTIAGTPLYMAPEQAFGRVSEVTPATDVYALGAMLHRLLAGRAPYAPRRGWECPERTVELIRRGRPTPLSRLAPDAPAELAALAERALARRPEERLVGAAELARGLRAFLAAERGRTEDA